MTPVDFVANSLFYRTEDGRIIFFVTLGTLAADACFVALSIVMLRASRAAPQAGGTSAGE